MIWGSISEEVSQAAKEDLTAVKNELRSDQSKRWQAIGTLKLILSFVNLPWELKKHTINFLLCITDGCISRKHDEHSEWSNYMTNLFSALQVVFCYCQLICACNQSVSSFSMANAKALYIYSCSLINPFRLLKWLLCMPQTQSLGKKLLMC